MRAAGMLCAAEPNGRSTVISTATIQHPKQRQSASVRAEPKAHRCHERARESRVIRSALRGIRAVSFCGIARTEAHSAAPFICG